MGEVTREEWEDVAKQLADLADACDAFEAWGFEAGYVLDDQKPPLVVVRGRPSK